MVKKTIIWVLSAIGLFYIVVTFYFSVFSDCHVAKKGLATSPDGKYVAKYYQAMCEDEPSKIKIWLGEQNSNKSTLIFSSIATTTENIQMTWLNEVVLHVSYPGSLNPTTTISSVENVHIKFTVSK